MTSERHIEVEIEAPATPEQAWEAVATGPGITAWFMPAEVEGRVGGRVIHRHDGEAETPGMVTAYEQPHRFVYEETGWGPDGQEAPIPIATEFLVEARSGGSCVVRVVMSGFGDGEAWERAIESFEGGWRQALRALRLYLKHFAGQQAASIIGGDTSSGDKDAVWAAFAASLGLPAQPAAGDHVRTDGAGVPRLGGVVEQADGRTITLLLDEPARGIALVGAGGPGDTVFTLMRAQLFGDGAEQLAAREQAAWEAWFAGRHVGAAG